MLSSPEDPPPTALSIDDLRWDVSLSGATEAQTFYMHLDDGSFLLVQVAYSTLALTPNVAVTVRQYRRGSKPVGGTTNHAGASLAVSEDRLSVSCDVIRIECDRDAFTYNLSIVSDALTASLALAVEDRGFKIRDGKHSFHPEGDESYGFVVNRIAPRAKVSGTIQLSGDGSPCASVQGVGVFTHVTAVKPQYVGRFDFLSVQGERDALVLYQFRLAASLFTSATNRVAQAALVLDGRLVAVTLDSACEHVETRHDDATGYDVPTEVAVSLRGQCDHDGRCVSVDLRFRPQNLCATVDVLGELPFLLRMFVSTFISNPFVYHFLEESVEARVSFEGEDARTISGSVFYEASMLAEMAAGS